MKEKRRGRQDLELEGPPEPDPQTGEGGWGARGGVLREAEVELVLGLLKEAELEQGPGQVLWTGRQHPAPAASACRRPTTCTIARCSHHAPAGSEPHTTTSAHHTKPPGPTPPVPHHRLCHGHPHCTGLRPPDCHLASLPGSLPLSWSQWAPRTQPPTPTSPHHAGHLLSAWAAGHRHLSLGGPQGLNKCC